MSNSKPRRDNISSSKGFIARYPIFGFTTIWKFHAFLAKGDIWHALPRGRPPRYANYPRRARKDKLLQRVREEYHGSLCITSSKTRRSWSTDDQCVYFAIKLLNDNIREGGCWHGRDRSTDGILEMAGACLGLANFVVKCKSGGCAKSWEYIVTARNNEKRRIELEREREREDMVPSASTTSSQSDSQNTDSEDGDNSQNTDGEEEDDQNTDGAEDDAQDADSEGDDDSSYSYPEESPPTSPTSSAPSAIYVPSRSASVEEIEPPRDPDQPTERSSTVAPGRTWLQKRKKRKNRAEANLLRKIQTLVSTWREEHQELSIKTQNKVIVSVGDRMINKYTAANVVEKDEIAASEMEDLDSIL